MNIKIKLREALLNEIGDSEGLPFKLVASILNTRHISLKYEFTVPKENDESYTIEVTNSSYVSNYTTEQIRNELGIEILENGVYLYVDFNLKDSNGKYEVINKGDVFKILTTVKSIVLDTIEQCEAKGLELVMIYSLPISNSLKGSNNSNIRKNMYDYLYKKFKRPSFELFQVGMYSGIYDKTKSGNQPNNKSKQEPIEQPQEEPQTSFRQEDIDRTISWINNKLNTSHDAKHYLHKTIKPSISGDQFAFNNVKLSFFVDIIWNESISKYETIVDFYPMDEKSLNFIIQNESRLVNLVD